MAIGEGGEPPRDLGGSPAPPAAGGDKDDTLATGEDRPFSEEEDAFLASYFQFMAGVLGLSGWVRGRCMLYALWWAKLWGEAPGAWVKTSPRGRGLSRARGG